MLGKIQIMKVMKNKQHGCLKMLTLNPALQLHLTVDNIKNNNKMKNINYILKSLSFILLIFLFTSYNNLKINDNKNESGLST